MRARNTRITCEGVLVEVHGAIVLVRDVEVPLEGTAGHEACPLLNASKCCAGVC